MRVAEFLCYCIEFPIYIVQQKGEIEMSKITFNKVDLQFQAESLISTLILNNGYTRDHRFSPEEGKQVCSKISKALEGNTILVPENDLRYQDYYTSFGDIIDMYTLSILNRNFNRFSFSREDVEYEIANSIARSGKVVYRTVEKIVEKPVPVEAKAETKDNVEIDNDTKEFIQNKIKDIVENMEDFDKLPEKQQFEILSKTFSKEFGLEKEKVDKLLTAIDEGNADIKMFNDIFGDIFEDNKETVVENEVPVEDTKEDIKEESIVTKEMIDKNYNEAKDLFHKKLNDNGIGCGFKVAKLVLKDYKQLLSSFTEDESFNMILSLINNRGLDYYEDKAKQDSKETKQHEDTKESEKEQTVEDDKSENETQEAQEQTSEEAEPEAEPEVEAEVVEEDEVKFPLVEEDLTKDDRQEVTGKPSLKYEEPKFNFKEGNKEAIKSFLEVSTKTDTKANVRKFINEKADKWEDAFNYENVEDVPVYMIKNVKHIKDEFPFIESTEDAGLNNNSITTFIASEFKEALKGMNKATLKELQEFAELCDVVDSMILDEYKAK